MAEKKKILIVEDEPHTIQTIKDRLEFDGYEVITAKDGEEALSKARNDAPNLILLDLMLPKMNGYEVCQLLKYDEKYKHIPIIMLTARTQETDRNMGKETGADEYVTKPFEFDFLIGRIKNYLEK
jgi:DNA-binding response OmpR family regulator